MSTALDRTVSCAQKSKIRNALNEGFSVPVGDVEEVCPLVLHQKNIVPVCEFVFTLLVHAGGKFNN